jgi:hypothetical protein
MISCALVGRPSAGLPAPLANRLLTIIGARLKLFPL